MFDPVQINKLYTFIKSKANGSSTKHMSQKRTANVIENKVGFALIPVLPPSSPLVLVLFLLLPLLSLQRLVLHSSGFISGNRSSLAGIRRHSATNILCQLIASPCSFSPSSFSFFSRFVFIFGKSKTANENCIQLSAFIVRINSWGKFH